MKKSKFYKNLGKKLLRRSENSRKNLNDFYKFLLTLGVIDISWTVFLMRLKPSLTGMEANIFGRAFFNTYGLYWGGFLGIIFLMIGFYAYVHIPPFRKMKLKYVKNFFMWVYILVYTNNFIAFVRAT